MGKFVVLNVYSVIGENAKLGITVSRRYGKAFKRNRFKRVVREVFRRYLHSFDGLEVNVRPRSSANFAKFSEVSQEILTLLKF